MSLQVWLPFTSSILQDNGIKGFSLSNVGSPNLSNDGKLGKCLNRVSDGTGIKIPSNLIEELGVEYSMAIWVKPLGNHTHYNGTFISSGDWNASQWAFGVSQDNTKVDVAGPGFNKYINCSVPVNQWTHLCCVIKNGVSKLYKNGNYIGSLNLKNGGRLQSDTNWTCIQRETYAGGYFAFNGKLNDLRIYDHALSLSEIKDISKGLVAHYTLNENSIRGNNQKLLNLSNGGIIAFSSSNLSNTPEGTIKIISPANSEWIGSGFRLKSDQFKVPWGYSYKVKTEVLINDPGLTLAIDFNNRTLSNSNPAGNDNDNGRKTQLNYIPGKWTPIYWSTINSNAKNTKHEDILPYDYIGLKTGTSARTWYIRNIEVIVDPIIVSDSSGHNYDANSYNFNLINMFSKNSPRNDSCINFSGNQYINCRRNAMIQDQITISWWGYMDNWANYTRAISCTEGGGWNFEPASSKMSFPCFINGNYQRVVDSSNLSSLSKGWHLFCSTYNGKDLKMYRDGKLTGTTHVSNYPLNIQYAPNNSILIGAEASGGEGPAGFYFNGKLSDVRIYGTALSDGDILQLYHTSAKIAKNGTMMSQGEFIEDNNLSINKNGNVISTKFIEDSSNVKITKSKELHTYNLMEV